MEEQRNLNNFHRLAFQAHHHHHVNNYLPFAEHSQCETREEDQEDDKALIALISLVLRSHTAEIDRSTLDQNQLQQQRGDEDMISGGDKSNQKNALANNAGSNGKNNKKNANGKPM